MCREAGRRGLRLACGFNHRRFEAVDFAHRLVESGKIGDVKGVKAYSGHPGGKEFAHSWVHEMSITGGGSLVDNGIHILDLVRYLGGEFESAAGFTAHLLWPFEAEDNAFALFRAADGRVASVHASWTEWRGARFRIEVIATRGYVEASYPPMRVEWGVAEAPGEKVRKHVELFTSVQMRKQLRGGRAPVVAKFAGQHLAFP